MNERQPQHLDIEQVIMSKAGNKGKYIPKFLINWFKKFMHIDFINEYLKEGYVGVEFCENSIKYLGAFLFKARKCNPCNFNCDITSSSSASLCG